MNRTVAPGEYSKLNVARYIKTIKIKIQLAAINFGQNRRFVFTGTIIIIANKLHRGGGGGRRFRSTVIRYTCRTAIVQIIITAITVNFGNGHRALRENGREQRTVISGPDGIRVRTLLI